MKVVAICAALAAMAGSATAAPTPQASVTADNVASVIRDGLRRVLKDPSSADLRITKGPILGRVVTSKRDEAGYLVCGELNAKNSYGAYVGVKDYLFVIDPADHSVKALERLDGYMLNTDAWRKVCVVSPPEVSPLDAAEQPTAGGASNTQDNPKVPT